MNKLQIKKAEAADIPIIIDFIKKLAEYEKLSHEVSVTEDQLEKSLFANDTNAFSIIGYLDNKPVAFALYFFNFSTFLGKKGLYLEDLFVLPEYRSNGIGKQMLKHLAQIAIDNDCGRFEWAVLDWNEPAIRFYKKLGAALKKEWIITRITGENLKKLSQ